MSYNYSKWVVLEKIHTPPTEDISAVRGGGRGDKIVSDNTVVNVLGHPKGVGGV